MLRWCSKKKKRANCGYSLTSNRHRFLLASPVQSMVFQGESKAEVRLLRQKYEMLESESQSQPTRKCSAKSSCPSSSDAIAASSESVFLVGGCDGESWLPSLNLYTPSSDMITSLKPMESARSYAPATKLNGNIYVLGGVDSETASCYNTGRKKIDMYCFLFLADLIHGCVFLN